MTGMPQSTSRVISGTSSAPPSSLTALAPASLMARPALRSASSTLT